MKIREVSFAEYRLLAQAYAAAVRAGRQPAWDPAPADKVHTLQIFGVQGGVGLRYGG